MLTKAPVSPPSSSSSHITSLTLTHPESRLLYPLPEWWAPHPAELPKRPRVEILTRPTRCRSHPALSVQTLRGEGFGLGGRVVGSQMPRDPRRRCLGPLEASACSIWAIRKETDLSVTVAP